MSLFPVGEWPLAHARSGWEKDMPIEEPVLLMGIEEGRGIVVQQDGSITYWDLVDLRIDFRLIDGAWKDLEEESEGEIDST